MRGVNLIDINGLEVEKEERIFLVGGKKLG
jgi:hypothetical protein